MALSHHQHPDPHPNHYPNQVPTGGHLPPPLQPKHRQRQQRQHHLLHNPRIRFDPWNSSATGHQQAAGHGIADNTGWRARRTAKLAHQFEGGVTGGVGRISDTVAEGGEGRQELLIQGRNGPSHRSAEDRTKNGDIIPPLPPTDDKTHKRTPSSPTPISTSTSTSSAPRKIFDGLRVYINGSTAPLVSDHRLKQLLAQYGAGVSISLGRRSVTHVILGSPNAGIGGGGAGGGLSATKIQKEVKRVGGCGVKYVGVEWVLQSIKAGHRLPEAPFSNITLAHKNQKSVYGLFKKNSAEAESSKPGSLINPGPQFGAETAVAAAVMEP